MVIHNFLEGLQSADKWKTQHGITSEI